MNSEELGLIDATRSHFAFLEREFGFRVTHEEALVVRYESSLVIVTVFVEVPSLEMGLVIAMRSERPQHAGFSMHYLIAASDPDLGANYRGTFVNNREQVDAAASDLASRLRQYGARALRGDTAAYKAMRSAADAQNRREDIRMTRAKAAEAFQANNYAKAVELYESMLPQLSHAENLKLKFARKHSSD